MSENSHLVDALIGIDWNRNVKTFSANTSVVQRLVACNYRIALWSKQFENLEANNPAIGFVREMQVAGHLVPVSVALATYKSAAAAMRTVLETALYFSFFRNHPVELTTLARGEKWYTTKQEILDFHSQHSPDFPALQHDMALLSALNPWYSKISAIVHGQMLGIWHQQSSVASIGPDVELQEAAVKSFEECTEIVHNLFLCTVGRELWPRFTTPAKRSLMKGSTKEFRVRFGLDVA